MATLLVLPLGDAAQLKSARKGGAGGGERAWRGFEGWRPLKHEDRANYDWMHEMLYEVRACA